MSPLLGNNSSYEHVENAGLYNSPESIVSLAIFILVFILGVPGNGLVIWVAGRKMKRTVNSVWFLNLAVADFLCCLSLPFHIAHLILHDNWPYGSFLCKVIPSAIIFNMFASVFLLTAISIDRCLLVMKPVWCQNRRTVRFAWVTCAIIWILAFVMCSPVFLYRETSVDKSGKTKCDYNYGDEEFYEYLYNGNDSDMNYDFFWDKDLGDYATVEPTGTHDDTLLTYQLPDEHLDFQIPIHPSASTIISPPSFSLLHSVVPNDLDATAATNSSTVSFAHPDFKSSEPPDSPPDVDPFTMTDAIIPLELSDLPGGPSGRFNDGMSSPENTMEDYSDYVPKSSLSVITLTITRTVFGFLLPFGIMAACYGLIAFKMHASQFKKPRGKTLQVIVVVVAALFVCWAPYHIVGILLLTVKPYTTLWKMLPLWDHLSIALAYVNSCINPVLYAFVGRDFREKACLSLKVILERALSEEVTHTTAYSCDRAKTSTDKDISSVL
ncbi:C3a anaphylatoxin chemotactic receptor [Alligator sinensis]|uniref:C3a anaphylatoxin chemotactic receptor n=1 Tax=Alligator sinensis TaxID=38654 RepID=A0A1U7S7L7_ALLSI|nr:C3a anaphylatoxin chemotactic receptor [Alligator sinensis]